jgi:predicted RNA-binding protein YlxR (DUF448 family)
MTTTDRPIRTCVACRQRDEQRSLRRFGVAVRGGERVVTDRFLTHAAGRSAYVHSTEKCIDRAATGRLLQRALRMPATVPAELAPMTTNTTDSSGPQM